MMSQLRRVFGHVAGVCAGVMFLTFGATLVPAGSEAYGTVSTSSIVGVAWKADNTAIPKAKLRLRNVVTGKIQSTAVANDKGEFLFNNLEGGSYIVELVSDRGSILAVGHTVTVGPGETATTFVRTGTKIRWFTGFFANAAAAVATAAAATGVTAVAPEEMRPVSPEK
jgi:hypothetical protein